MELATSAGLNKRLDNARDQLGDKPHKTCYTHFQCTKLKCLESTDCKTLFRIQSLKVKIILKSSTEKLKGGEY